MTFREAYKEEMQHIKPETEFLCQLAGKMQETQQQTKRREYPYKKAGKKWIAAISSAAAVLLLAVGAGRYLLLQKQNQVNNKLIQNAGSVSRDNTKKFTASWYQKGEDAQTVYEHFLQTFEKEGVTVYKSSKKTISEKDVISADACEELRKRLMQGTYAGTYKEYSRKLQDAVYYIVENAEGTVIRFTIYDSRYVYCPEYDGVFRIESES